MLTYKDKLRAAIEGTGNDSGSISSDSAADNEDNNDVLSFTPSMADDSAVLVSSDGASEGDADALLDRDESIISSVTASVQDTSQRSSTSHESEEVNETTEENPAQDSAPSSATEAPTCKSTTEATDTGAFLQAGSIFAGVVGIGLMLAFGGGGKKEPKKEARNILRGSR